MKLLKNIALITLLLAIVTIAKAQNGEVLAEANGQKYTVQDLDPATREMYLGLNKNLANERTEA
ncbi:MAG TPA: hypothetical protein PKY82_27765, partial [Pyrinomonadaceae bacterium]|nr:hypothetical protein [Pyrinomonadaceae bacterium]